MEFNLFVRVMIFLTLGIFVWLFLPFLNAFIVALLLVTAFTPIQLWLESYLVQKRFEKNIASLVSAAGMTLFLFLVLFLPIIFFVVYIAIHPNELIAMGNTLFQQVSRLGDHLPSSLHSFELYIDQGVKKLQEHQTQIATTLAINVGNGLLGFLAEIGEMLLIITFFFFLSWYRRPILLAIAPIIPIHRKIRQEFILDMIATSAAGLYTLIGVAIAQGIAFGVFISFFDPYDPWLFGLLIGVTSVVPIVGTALVFIPVALNEFFSGNGLNALIILVYSWAMLSFFIDNILRIVILKLLNRYLSHGRKPIDDFLIFFAIMAGLTTFGFWGFLIGPAIVAFTVTLFRVLRRNHIVR